MFCFLFDLDGTLVLTGGAGIRAFDQAFREIFQTEGKIKSISPAGKTDPAILQMMCNRYLERNPTEEEQRAVFSRYLEILKDEVEETDKFEVMPGIRPLLEYLHNHADCLLGLGTGNIKAGAEIKLRRPDLWKYFHFGGFGSDAPERSQLLQRALDRGTHLLKPGEKIHKVFVIGDTPNDIQAGHAIHAQTVGVATGPYPVKALEEAGADRVYKDLSAYQDFLGDVGVS
ncbi:MAG: HAD family hydrolase [Planctomycetota bacterium]